MTKRYAVLVYWGGELANISVFGTWHDWEIAEAQAENWTARARKRCAGDESAPIAWVVEIAPKGLSAFRLLFKRVLGMDL